MTIKGQERKREEVTKYCRLKKRVKVESRGQRKGKKWIGTKIMRKLRNERLRGGKEETEMVGKGMVGNENRD